MNGIVNIFSYSFLLYGFFALFVVVDAKALSCADPVLDAAVIETSALIFEGTVIEKTGEVNTFIPKKGGSLNDLKGYQFKITKLWKGDISGDTVDIVRNAYWGDGFHIGSSYLVVANKIDGQYLSAICGHTRPIDHAENKIDTLKKHYRKPYSLLDHYGEE